MDPDAVVKNAGIPGGYVVDREKREVLFPHRWQLWGVAEFFGRTLWEGATGFTAYGWHWKLLDNDKPLPPFSEEGTD